jgi:hypothetical protein
VAGARGRARGRPVIGLAPLLLAAQLGAAGRGEGAGAEAAREPALAEAAVEPAAAVAAGAPDDADDADDAALSDEALERRGAVIDHVTVRVGDIFDPSLPGEDRALFRWANRLHRETRDGVIRRQLLFAPGDRYSRRLLAESERLLRGDRYLYDATIRPVRRHDGDRVDVEVVTRDVWTLDAGFSFGRKGGANSTRFQVEDTNVLGTGMLLALEHSDGVDRSGNELRFAGPDLLGGHARLDLGYADNSDGARWHLRAGRPFFALDSRWAAEVSALDDDRVDSRWLRGRATDRFRHRERDLELSGGLSRGLGKGGANRWTAGVTYSRDLFAPAAGAPAPAELPADRTLVYPWIGFEHVEDAWIEDRDLDKIGRTEDLFVGRSLRARVGYSSPLLGADRGRLVFDGAARAAWELRGEQLLDLSAHAGGRWGDGGAEDLVLGAGLAYHRRDLGRHVFFAGLSADAAARLDHDHQLTLGGDSGLRGYPLRYQDGDRRWLLTLEQRFVTDWRPFHLVQVGAAVFVDAGRSWFADGRGDGPGGGVLTDVGIGLRLGHTRSGRGSMIHLDLAFPLDGDRAIASPQWLISSKETF